MGFTPQQVDEMSLWQFACAVGGYAEAHGAEPAVTYPSDAEFAEALRHIN